MVTKKRKTARPKTIRGTPIPLIKDRIRFTSGKNTGGTFTVVKKDLFTGERTPIKVFKTKRGAKGFISRKKRKR